MTASQVDYYVSENENKTKQMQEKLKSFLRICQVELQAILKYIRREKSLYKIADLLLLR